MKTNTVRIQDLQSGMLITEDILHNNSVLLPAGTRLNSTYIDKLSYLQIEGSISIEDDSNDSITSQKSGLEISHSMESASNKLLQISTNLKTFFSARDIEESLNNHEIDNIQSEMIDNFELLKHTLKDIFLSTSLDDYLYVHSLNVAFISYLLGRWMDFSETELSDLVSAALLHDIGKLKINQNLLYKTDRLSEKEFEVIKKHPLIGYNLIKNSDVFSEYTALGILTHHERADGQGYPLRLKRDQIHIFGKIISIADTFSAMTVNRPFKKKINPLEALEIMNEESFSKYDYEVWIVFYKNMLNYYTGDTVLLNTGEKGRIIIMYPESPSRPLLYVEDTYFAHLRLDTSRWITSFPEKQ